MSTSIAHELNQPLAALRTLSGNTVRFLERGALDTASTNLRTMNDLIDRMGRITASLRAFARRGDDKGQASLSGAVDAALQLLEARLQGVQVRQDIEAAQLPIDQTRLEQILVNLIGNALDAMQGQAEPQLWLSSERDQQPPPGKYRLRVRDNGHGITLEAREHLFEPFFTTKPGDHGLGLGLTLSASLAAAAGGHLGMESSGPDGTVFILSLPLGTAPLTSPST
jgi:two-component system sensor histidine kinase AauS